MKWLCAKKMQSEKKVKNNFCANILGGGGGADGGGAAGDRGLGRGLGHDGSADEEGSHFFCCCEGRRLGAKWKCAESYDCCARDFGLKKRPRRS
jgi:hypothetical protein